MSSACGRHTGSSGWARAIAEAHARYSIMEPPGTGQVIGLVGPCGSGKSTLMAALQHYGFRCRHIAQEHSYVQTMWQVIARPDILIYLATSFPVSTARRKLYW